MEETTSFAVAMAVLRLSSSAIVVMDAEGRITAFNGPAERLLAIGSAQAVGRKYAEVLGPSLADRMVGLIMRAGRSAVVAPHLLQATLPGGRRARLRATAGPLLDERGELIGCVFIVDDLGKVEAAGPEAHPRPAPGNVADREMIE